MGHRRRWRLWNDIGRCDLHHLGVARVALGVGDPSHTALCRGARCERGELPGGLDELLHDDVVFYSPIVFTPQRGKAITSVAPVAEQTTEDFRGAPGGFIVFNLKSAGNIARVAGLIGPDKSWCPINATTFESTMQKSIHVIGDACVAGAMPKSGYSANSEAKVCAANIVALMSGKETIEMSGINVCYSAISAKEAVSVAGVYAVKDGKIIAVPNSGGVSPDLSEVEAVYASSWLKNILTEMST